MHVSYWLFDSLTLFLDDDGGDSDSTLLIIIVIVVMIVLVCAFTIIVLIYCCKRKEAHQCKGTHTYNVFVHEGFILFYIAIYTCNVATALF